MAATKSVIAKQAIIPSRKARCVCWAIITPNSIPKGIEQTIIAMPDIMIKLTIMSALVLFGGLVVAGMLGQLESLTS